MAIRALSSIFAGKMKSMIDHRRLFSDVRERPSAYGLNGSYGQAVAFVTGCDASTSWQLLANFRKWLAIRLGYGENLVWPELVRRLALLPPAKNSPSDDLDSEQESAAVNMLFDLLDAFLAAEGETGGTA
jgi:hypothetical protein